MQTTHRNPEDIAWQLLIDTDTRSLPVRLNPIIKHCGIKLIKNSDVNLLSPTQLGAAVCMKEKWYIVYESDDSTERIRFTIAHEIAHILLGHQSREYRTMKKCVYRPEAERHADGFASRLLMPSVILVRAGITTRSDIMKYCNVSRTAAVIRENRIADLIRRNAPFSSPLETQLYENFKPWISTLSE